VVLLVRSIVFRAQEKYLQRRFAWLKNLPCPRCSTILVEGIPEEWRSEDRVRQFFSATFDARVMQVNMVRHTELLDQLSSERLVAKGRLRESERLLERDGSRPTARVRFAGEPVDAISYFLGEMQDKHQLIQQEVARIRQESASLGGLNSHCAFVTFGTRQDAAIAKTLDFSQDGGHWVITDAPEVSSIRWGKLSLEPTLLRTVSGIVLITFLYAGFTPICVAISNLAQSLDVGPLQPLWSAFAPTLGLTVFLALLPTVLLLIFDACFLPRSDTAAQHLLQFWYFAFLLFFVLFLPIIGTSFREFAHQVYKSPAQVFGLVAARVPEAAEFFFDYVVLMWSVACVELLRVMILLKFIIYRSLYPEAEAAKMAEPEDQDYCGMGGRMARWNLTLCIGVVFSSVFPLVSLAVLVKFLLQQVAYGYLLVFAETRKPDLGGVFWVQALTQLLYCMVFYAVVMTGVLLQRSDGYIPAALALLSGFVAVASVVQFKMRFRWQSLPYPEVVKMDKEYPIPASTVRKEVNMYVQPSLNDSSLPH